MGLLLSLKGMPVPCDVVIAVDESAEIHGALSRGQRRWGYS